MPRIALSANPFSGSCFSLSLYRLDAVPGSEIGPSVAFHAAMIFKRTTNVLLPQRRTLACGVVLNERGHERFLETIVVIALIALLVTLAVEGFRPFVDKSRMIEAANLVNSFRPDIVEYFAVNGELPDEMAREEGWFSGAGKYFDRMDWQRQEIVFDLNHEIAGRFSAGAASVAAASIETQLSFRIASTADGGRRVFLCGNASAPPGFIASESQHTNVREDLLPFFCRA